MCAAKEKLVVFVHPDLGIGGAERLVVDAGVALQHKGYKTHFVTSHCDPKHCFDEVKDGTLQVTVIGDWIPRNIMGKFHALCAYLRMMYIALYTVFFSDLQADLYICDQISVCVPILKVCGTKVIFYCHFPDLLLSSEGHLLKTLYRSPLNWLEEVTTGSADCVLVNSKFTQGVFKDTFETLAVTPRVLYPCLNTHAFDNTRIIPLQDILEGVDTKDKVIFLSINRYEKKKALATAVAAMAALRTMATPHEWEKFHLVLCGGYDARVAENVREHAELWSQCGRLGIASKVTLLRSPSQSVKCSLLRACTCLVYTPSFEHFGIVPVEAMYAGKAVVAVAQGGPLETVVPGRTGLVVPPPTSSTSDGRDAAAFARAMLLCARRPRHDVLRSAHEARTRVLQNFSLEAFADRLDAIVGEFVCAQ